MTNTPLAVGAWCRRHCMAHWLMVVALALVAWMFWPTSLGGSTSFVVVSGSSMQPTYRTGDVLVMRRGSPSPGDVIAFTVPGRNGTIVHRVLERRADGTLLVKGDNRSTPDLPLPTDAEVVGRAMALIPQGWVVLRLLTSPLVLGVGAASVLLASTVRHHHRHAPTPSTPSAIGPGPT